MKKTISTRTFFTILSLGAVLAAIVSLLIGLQQSVWFDEAYSILLAQQPWGEIVRLTAEDVHPPVYYWLLKGWMMLFGSGELALRSMSALLFGASIFMAGLLLKKCFGSKSALLALPFLVLAPFLLRYGFEIRMYSLASLIGITATYVLVAAVEEKTRQRRWLLFAGYALLVAFGVYTLYFVALLWIAHVAWLAWLAHKDRRRDIVLPALVSYAASFLLFVPWLPVFIAGASGGTIAKVTSELGFENLYGIMTFLFLYQPSWEVTALNVAAVLIAIVSIAYVALQAYKNALGEERRYLALLGAYFIVPVLVLIIVTHVKPVYLERYMAHIAIGVYAGVGVLAALALRGKNTLAKVASGALVVILLIGCVSLARYGNYNFQRVHEPTVEQVAALLEDCERGSLIFAEGPQIAMELGYYITDCPIYFFNETLEMTGGFAMLSGSPLRVASAEELPKAQTVLWVYYNEPVREVPNTFVEQGDTKIEALGVIEYQTGEL